MGAITKQEETMGAIIGAVIGVAIALTWAVLAHGVAMRMSGGKYRSSKYEAVFGAMVLVAAIGAAIGAMVIGLS